eukprot:s3100_g5.t1
MAQARSSAAKKVSCGLALAHSAQRESSRPAEAMARCTMNSGNAPVKNTFIHFSDSEEEATGVRRRNSEPALWPAPCTNVTFSALKGMGEQLVAHATGNCKPCSFFFFKEDGCRRGNSCSFCHLCSEDTARRQKRSGQRKARAVKRAVANQVRRGGLVPTPGSESSLMDGA